MTRYKFKSQEDYDLEKTSLDVFLETLKYQDTKQEFSVGNVYAMVGGTHAHNRLFFELGYYFKDQLKGTACRLTTSDQLIVDKNRKQFAYYPDLVICCGQPNFHDSNQIALTNPKLVAEVLSPSTEHIDKGTKLYHYQTIESLTDYLILSPTEMQVMHWYRLETSEWASKKINQSQGLIEIPSLNFSLPLQMLYSEVL